MKTRTKNFVIVCSCIFICALGLATFLHIRKATQETKEVAKQEIKQVADKVEEKIDATAQRVKEDYSGAKEKVKTKYADWKKRREEAKANKESEGTNE